MTQAEPMSITCITNTRKLKRELESCGNDWTVLLRKYASLYFSAFVSVAGTMTQEQGESRMKMESEMDATMRKAEADGLLSFTPGTPFLPTSGDIPSEWAFYLPQGTTRKEIRRDFPEPSEAPLEAEIV